MMFIFGLLNGSTDIALFTVRQRRTDPAWMGRAFAVSMAFNFVGFPIGAAIAGAVVSVSLAAAIWFADRGLRGGGGAGGGPRPGPGARARLVGGRGDGRVVSLGRQPRSLGRRPRSGPAGSWR